LKKTSEIIGLLIAAALFLGGCVQAQKGLNQQQAIEIAWEYLEPRTAAHNRDDWEIHAARKTYGREVVAEFSVVRPANCPGPIPPDNLPIKLTAEYWYIKVLPHPEALRPVPGDEIPTLAIVQPEPNIVEAAFLIDVFGGKIIATRLICR